MATTVSKVTPSVDRATTTARPRPSSTGRRVRYARYTVPSSSQALGAPAQWPGPSPGAGTTTVEDPKSGTGADRRDTVLMAPRLGQRAGARYDLLRQIFWNSPHRFYMVQRGSRASRHGDGAPRRRRRAGHLPDLID